MNEQWEALTDEQREAITEAVERVAKYIAQVCEDLRRLAEAIIDGVTNWLDSLPPDFLDALRALIDEVQAKQRQSPQRPPRKIGTPHDGYVNMRLCCPPKLC